MNTNPTKLKIAIGADHGGLPLKVDLQKWLHSQGYQVLDLGAYSNDPADDYPDFAYAVAKAVAVGQAQKGLVICGSGVGASITANKVPGIRAALCHDTYSARQGVEHDDMNVICMGARIIGIELAKEIVSAFLNARFIDEGRYRRRLNKLLAIEAESLKSSRPANKR
ncbi:MAG: ribose 5-phosphate isomerase B [SAR202 cluster bacterium]|nr:ribose 5-phosphate isomerase B [SAR202 cluster bacterium]